MKQMKSFTFQLYGDGSRAFLGVLTMVAFEMEISYTLNFFLLIFIETRARPDNSVLSSVFAFDDDN